MKVLICFNESIHYGLAAASRVSSYAKGLAQNDVEVEVMMPFSFLAKKDIYFQKSGEFNGVKYNYTGFLPYHPKNKYFFPLSGFVLVFSRWYSYLKYLSFFLRNHRKYEIVFVYKFSTFFTFLILVLNLKKICISELCEIPYHNKVGTLKRINRYIREITVFKMFDGFVVISKNLLDYISLHKANAAKLLKVPILTDSEQATSKEIKTSATVPGVPYLLHTGSITEQKDGLIGIIKAFAVAKKKLNKPIKLIITGFLEYSPDKELIVKCISDYDITDDVVFVGFLPKADLKVLQINCSLAIINKYENEQNFYCFPTKLAEYLSNGIAVIATSVGEISHFLNDNENAYIVQPGDITQMAEKIILAFSDEDKRKSIAQMGQLTAENEFNYHKHGARLKVFFSNLYLNRFNSNN